jgi:galactonate dehydratase
MRITAIELLQADGLWRPFSFLKISTDEGLIGWSEFVESSWAPGLRHAILALVPTCIGRDPRTFARLSYELHAQTLFTAGGVSHQAVAAIENACIDIAAKAAGQSVSEYFGGGFRTSIELYWSHCGSFRASHGEQFEKTLGTPTLRRLEDFEKLGQEARARGFRCVKTNPIEFTAQGPRLLNPGFRIEGLNPARGLDERTRRAICDQAAALRAGLGPDIGLMLDVNFGFRADALCGLTQDLRSVNLRWLEADVLRPESLAAVKRQSMIPIASLESLYGRRSYLPWLNLSAVDTAIVDVPWNGFAESIRIAALAETFDVNVAPHNFYGPVADLMSAHYCAATPNVAMMEFEADDVPWKHQLLTKPPRIEYGSFHLPTGLGWGADVDEQAVAEHPWPAHRSA